MKRYHTKYGFPDTVQLPKGRIDFTVSPHAKRMSEKRGLTIPDTLYIIPSDIIEVKLKNDQIHRILIRQGYNDKEDICAVLNTDYRLITAWLIDKEDTHKTLNKNNYTIP